MLSQVVSPDNNYVASNKKNCDDTLTVSLFSELINVVLLNSLKLQKSYFHDDIGLIEVKYKDNLKWK